MGVHEESPISYTAEEVFGEEKIDRWRQEGHWPPPVGLRVLPEIRIEPEKQEQYTQQLLDNLPPHLRKIAEEILRPQD